MISLSAQQLMLGLVPEMGQMSLNPAAWGPLAQRGLVATNPPVAETDPAVVVTITDAGRRLTEAEPPPQELPPPAGG